MKLAQEIAQLLDRDPILASRIKEFIKEDRLREVLDLPEHAPSEKDEGGWREPGPNALLCVLEQYKLSEVISAYKSQGGLLN